jgi:Protein of unknown function (DUF1552)
MILSNWKRPAAPSRRRFLKILGLAPALAPFVPLFDVEAATAPAKRLVQWFTPHGTIYNQWKTTGEAAAPTLGPIMNGLKPHLPKLTVLEGMRIKADGVGAPHTKGPPLLWTASPLIEDMTFTRSDGSGGMYYGWNSAASIDQVILSKLAPKTPYASLEFGLRSGGSHPGSRMIYTGAEKPLAPETEPKRAFSRLFGNGLVSQKELEALAADRRSVLDLVRADLGVFRSKLGPIERRKLDAHNEAIFDIEKRLGLAVAACTAPVVPADSPAPQDAQNTQVTFKLQMDVMAAALACGLTNFASMQYRVGENDGGYTYSWLGVTVQEHHLLTHSADNDAAGWGEAQKIYTWYHDMFAYFLDRLSKVDEGNGSLLDNTMVVWGSELGKGNNHSFDNVPFVVAGGKNLGIKGGRALRFPAGALHNRLLVSMANVMGVTDMNTFGKTDTGTGPLPGL